MANPNVAPEVAAAFWCEASGLPHAFEYLRNTRSYRCRLCLAKFTKAQLKTLTDDA